MGSRASSDRILTEADYIRLKDECEARRAKVDPRNVYTISYKITGNQLTQEVIAFTAKDAEEIVKQQCGMVGWIPTDIKILNIKPADEANA